jgi:hypothetical protein
MTTPELRQSFIIGEGLSNIQVPAGATRLFFGFFDGYSWHDNSGSLEVTVILNCPTPVEIDIKPGSCPNPLNLKSRGVLPVAILGSEYFDVNTIHLVSLRLEGVAPIRSSYEDVTGSARDTDDCNCMEEGPDGYTDLMLKFETQEIVEALADTYDNIGKSDILPMEMTGELSDATLIEGWDCIQIVGKVPEWIAVKKFDANSDGMVNMEDFALMAEQWMKSYSLDL